MTALEELQAQLKSRHITVTDDQATAMAVRIAGGVDAYLAKLKANQDEAAAYVPPTTEPSGKFSEPVTYDVESLAQSGIPGGDA